MFIISINYIVPLEEIDQNMAVHLQHLRNYYDKGIFIAWGSKVPRTGGVILALAVSKEAVEQIITEDPFYQLNLAKFNITELSMAEYHPDLKNLLG